MLRVEREKVELKNRWHLPCVGLQLVPAHQGWEFAHSLIAHLLIRSFCSNQISYCERFAQITQEK